MDLALADKVVLVTGASGGIGRAVAEAFAGEGARVVAHGHRNWKSLEAWLADRPWSDRALAVRADVARPEELEAAFDRALSAFGRVDACVANAGIWSPDPLLLHEVPAERIRKVLEVNLLGAIWTARAFMAARARPGARPDGHGASLVLIGSTAARFGESHHAEYSISKAGLYGALRSLKNEIVHLDPFARVNLVEPGWTATPMAMDALEVPGAISGVTRTMALRQIGRPEDVARAVVFLSSHAAARHLSGEVLTVAGGMEGRSLWGTGEIDEEAVRRRLGED